MKSLQEEQREYEKFAIEFGQKLYEIQQDYNKLSVENKYRFQNELMNMLFSRGVVGVMDYFNHLR